MIKRVLLLFLVFFVLKTTISSQVLFYGLIPKDHVDRANDDYNSVENGLLDGGYEIGLICFDIRDSGDYELESALYMARSLSAKSVLVWRFIGQGVVSLKVYSLEGVLLSELEARPEDAGGTGEDKAKSITQSYFKIARNFVMQLEGKLQ